MEFTVWLYEQSTGRMFDRDGELAGEGYSGSPEGRNNALLQDVHNVGPCPVGFFTFGSLFDSFTHGKNVLALTPDPGNDMFGRDHFLVHGDSVVEPGTASEGCIIQPLATRLAMGKSSDHRLQVVETRI